MAGEEYDVGYGKPPKHTRFKKGQSGNAKGRKKGAKGYKSMLVSAFAEPITLTINGQRKTMTRGKAITNVLMAKAMKGDMAALRSCLRLMEHAAGFEGDERQAAVDNAKIAEKFRRIAGVGDPEA